MEGHTKIQLSDVEMDLVNNTGWILTKHEIIKKVYVLFGVLSESMRKEVAPFEKYLPAEVIQKNAKITRGENYKMLPYVILDYPAFFDRDHIFAVRTMFWWGNFFSITLQLSGRYKHAHITDPAKWLAALKQHNFYVCINDSAWQHHFEPTNYISAATCSSGEFEKIYGQAFFKVARKIPLTEWGNAANLLLDSFRVILQLVKANFQGGEKDPSPVFPIIGSGP